jgi:hypothetical protein
MIGGAPLRRVRRIRGYGALLVGAVLAASMILAPYPPSARRTAVVVIVLIVAFGAFQLWLAVHTPDTAVVQSSYVDPNTLPMDIRLRYFKRQLLLSFMAFSALSWWSAHQLNQLESGAAETVQLWAPVAFIYEHLGYTAALLATPLVGIIFCAVWINRMNYPGSDQGGRDAQ